ncbi:MAG: ankyrin repeat domain-containing protein [Bacteroidales bacterium]|nr:ankyrin repeat domain-containing protein [Bacteroidales bacterium]
MKAISKSSLIVALFLIFSVALKSQDDKFLTAAANGDLSKVNSFIKKGGDVNTKNNLKWTALSYAAKFGHLDVVKVLIENGANINYKNNTGFTPVVIAFLNNQESIFKYLIEKGADVNIKDMVGMSVLAYAVKENKLNAVKYLVEQGKANVNIKNSSGRTPMDVCTNDEISKYLRANGAKTGKELMSGTE